MTDHEPVYVECLQCEQHGVKEDEEREVIEATLGRIDHGAIGRGIQHLDGKVVQPPHKPVHTHTQTMKTCMTKCNQQHTWQNDYKGMFDKALALLHRHIVFSGD